MFKPAAFVLAATLATPAAAQVVVDVEGPNRSGTVTYEREKTEDGVTKTRTVESGDYNSQKVTQRQWNRDTRSGTRTTDWSNSNGKNASSATSVQQTGRVRVRNTSSVGPNGNTRNVEKTTFRGPVATSSKKSVTGPKGNTRVKRSRTVRPR